MQLILYVALCIPKVSLLAVETLRLHGALFVKALALIGKALTNQVRREPYTTFDWGTQVNNEGDRRPQNIEQGNRLY
jgi:hypothetical protein